MSPHHAETTESVSSSQRWIWVGVAFGAGVFLLIAALTIPKYPRRKAAIDRRAEARSRVWQQQLEREGAVADHRSNGVRDWWLIGGVAAGGALLVLGLALAALRPRPVEHGELGGAASEPGDAPAEPDLAHAARAPPEGQP